MVSKHLKPGLWDIKLGQSHHGNTVLKGPRGSLVEKLNSVLFSWRVIQTSVGRLLGGHL